MSTRFGHKDGQLPDSIRPNSVVYDERPVKASIFATNAEAINPHNAEIDFDLGGGVSVTHFRLEPVNGEYSGILKPCNVIEVDFSPSMGGLPSIAAARLLEAVQPMGALVMNNLARNIRNVDATGHITLPTVRYSPEGIAYRSFVTLPAPEYILFRTHRAMAIRARGILNRLKSDGAIGEYMVQTYNAEECPSLAAAILKYAQNADERVTEKLVSRVYIMTAPILHFDPRKDASLIEETTRSLPFQPVFAIGKQAHGK